MTERTVLRLFEEYHPLFRFAYRLTGSAADLLRPYLYGTVRNQALKRLGRREVPAGDEQEPMEDRSPETFNGAAAESEANQATGRDRRAHRVRRADCAAGA